MTYHTKYRIYMSTIFRWPKIAVTTGKNCLSARRNPSIPKIHIFIRETYLGEPKVVLPMGSVDGQGRTIRVAGNDVRNNEVLAGKDGNIQTALA
jgi:hypothetical protein